MMKGLFNYETAFKAYTEACIEDFINDNIQYAEVRPNFPSNNLTKDDGVTIISNSDVLQIIANALEKQKQTGRYFGGMKVIYCCPRSFSREQVEASLNECLELKRKFPGLICGMLSVIFFCYFL
jgi:adenosine deaminase CECR1